jgi:eukaryotic-like serine/threonine-protein kinase
MNKVLMCTEDRFEKLALLFEEAVEITTEEERSAFLDRACGEDSILRHDVAQLLDAHKRAGQFLRTEARLETPNLPEFEDDKSLQLKPGDQLGPYHLVGLIGEGGSSIVYLAEQEQPVRRWVALKIIKAGMDTKQIITRFKLERQALAVMDHPGIAKVLDAGATPSGRPYFVMELVRGVEITRYCDDYRLDINKRLELFAQVCQAVLHAHQKGIVHRDIKPENILVCEHDGRPFPKVIDFGIAKVLHAWVVEGTPATIGLPFLGTPAYMSPEQAQSSILDLDTRTDIYSLGALLYELLVGHPPFEHTVLLEAGLDKMRSIITSQEPPAPSARFTQLPRSEQEFIANRRGTTPDELYRAVKGDLDWIVLKAIEKERERRYDSTANLTQDLSCHMQHLPVSAAAPTLRYRLSKLIRRNRKSVTTAAVIGALILASAIINASMAVRATASAQHAQKQQVAAVDAQRQSHYAVVSMHISSGFAAAEEGNYDRAALWFANAARAAGPHNPEQGYNLRRAVSWLEQSPVPSGILQLQSELTILEFCPHSRYLAALDYAGNCLIWDCTAERELKWVPEVGRVNAAAWSPSGGALALALRGGRAQLRYPPDGKLLFEIPQSEDATALGFTPDGKYLFFGNGTVRVLDMATLKLRDESWEHPAPVAGFSSSSGPGQMVSACRDGQARVLRLRTDGEGGSVANGPAGTPPTFPHRCSIRTDSCASKTNYREDFLHTAALSLPGMGCEGKVVATRTGPFEVTLWETGSGGKLSAFEGLCCSCRFLVSPNGTLIACGLQGSKVGFWDAATGRPRGVLASFGACILDLAFGPAGENVLVAEANGTAKLWSIADGRRFHSVMHHSMEVDKVAYRGDGQMIATAQGDGLVRIWQMPTVNADRHVVAAEYGPKIMRLDPEKRRFVISKEPGWQIDFHKTSIYEAETGNQIGPTLEFNGHVEDAALSAGCEQVVVALHWEEDGLLSFHDAKTGQALGHVPLPGIPCSVAWNPREMQVAVICRTGELLLARPDGYDLLAGASEREDSAISGRINPLVSYTDDGQRLISLTPAGRLEVRNGQTGRLLYPAITVEGESFWHFAIAGDNRRVATTTRTGNVRVWNLEAGSQCGSTLRHPGWVYRCRFSPDGSHLVTAGHDGKGRIWDLGTGKLACSALAHPNEVYDATYTPDGRWVLTACRDGEIRIWEPVSGRLVSHPKNVGDQAFTVDIAGDGQFAVIGSLGSVIHIISLALLQEEVTCDVGQLCLLTEVVSGSTIAAGDIRDLTTAEWIDRYQVLMRGNDGSQTRGAPAFTLASLKKTERVSQSKGAAAPAQLKNSCSQASTCKVADCPSKQGVRSP